MKRTRSKLPNPKNSNPNDDSRLLVDPVNDSLKTKAQCLLNCHSRTLLNPNSPGITPGSIDEVNPRNSALKVTGSKKSLASLSS